MATIHRLVKLASTFCALLLALHSSVAIADVGAKSNKNEVGHQAHARPGGAYFAVDWKRKGCVKVKLDASNSHTHYSDPDDPTRPGYLTRYEWYNLTDGTCFANVSFPFVTTKFYLGVTRIKLAVTDNTGDVSEATTYVKVRNPMAHEIRRPVLKSISPHNGPVSGGTYITIRGAAFYNNPMVKFGLVRVQPLVHSEKELTFEAPAAPHPRVVRVSIQTGFGVSPQSVMFRYERSLENPVLFRDTVVRNSEGNQFRIPMMTCIKLGPDGRYYIGTRGGFIHTLSITRSFVVRSSCRSSNVGIGRSVLGLSIDPFEVTTKSVNHAVPRFSVYISTSQLMRNALGGDWDNGRVEIWEKLPNVECVKFVKVLISGLPVSTRDHSVSALVFHPDGSLLVAVGGSTNAGVPKMGKDMMKMPESPLSGAILSFPFREMYFNGTITYEWHDNPGKTEKASGSVRVYAAGIRNVFGMALHSNGHVYGLDNGPNIGYGVAATGCFRTGGQVQFVDKLIDIRRGGYYGHPNWNRGRTDKRQCKFISGDSENMGRDYTAAMMSMESSTNGIVEYTANRFDGSLMGHLILSQLAWEVAGDVTAVKLNKKGNKVDDVRVLHTNSGIAIEMGMFGELVIPSYGKGNILVLAPFEKHTPPLRVIAVNPKSGRAGGGNFVTVTGNGFKRGDVVWFGRRKCRELKWVRLGHELRCRVPRYKGGNRKIGIVVRRARKNLSSNFRNAPTYEYLKRL